MRVLAPLVRELLIFACAAAACGFANLEPLRAVLVGLMVWVLSGLHRGGPALQQWLSTLPP